MRSMALRRNPKDARLRTTVVSRAGGTRSGRPCCDAAAGAMPQEMKSFKNP